MSRFEVSVTLVVEADDDSEAYHVAQAAVDNMAGGSIVDYEMGGVTDLSMAEGDISEPI